MSAATEGARGSRVRPMKGPCLMSVLRRRPRPAQAAPEPAADRTEAGPVGELTDSQWAAVALLLPPGRSTGRRRTVNVRRIVAAIDYHWRTGCAWRNLPPGFPPWSTVYTYYRGWVKDGTLRELRAVLNPPKSSEVRPSTRKTPRPPRKLDPDRESPVARTNQAPSKPR